MNKRLAILGLLALGVWLAVSLWPEPQPDSQDQGPAWPALDARDVTSLKLATEQGDFSLEKRQGAWLMPQNDGSDFRADTANTDALLDFIAGHAPIRRLSLDNEQTPSEENLAPYGLDKPQSVLTMHEQTAAEDVPEKDVPDTWRIALGQKNPAGDGVYALSSSEPGLLLLDASYVEQLSRPASHYWELDLLEATAETVHKIRLEAAEGPPAWEMEREQQPEDAASPTGWRFTWPEELEQNEVDVYEANMYAHDLATLTGARYLSGWTPPDGEPTVMLTVWTTGRDEPETLAVYEIENTDPKAGALWAGVSSWQTAPVALEPKQLTPLIKGGFLLSRREVIDFDRAAVMRMELEPAGKDSYSPLVAVSDGAAWKATDDRDMQGFDVLLWRLGDLKFLGEGRSELPQDAEPALTWRLYGQAGKDDAAEPMATVHFYEDETLPPGQCWAVVEEPYTVYPVERELLDDLRARLSKAAPQ